MFSISRIAQHYVIQQSAFLSHGEILTSDGRWTNRWDLAREIAMRHLLKAGSANSCWQGRYLCTPLISWAEENRLISMTRLTNAPSGSWEGLKFGVRQLLSIRAMDEKHENID